MISDSPVYDTTDNDMDNNEKTPILSNSESQRKSYEENTTCYVYLLSFFAAIGAFLFGYDTGVISGAMILLKKRFDLSDRLQEIVVSITVGGAIFGAMTSGCFNERFGRKIVLLIASFVFTAGAILMGVASSVVEILIGRLIVGIGIGYASSTVPVYIAEAAPAHKRGQLVTINQLFITFGQFSASVLNGAFNYIGDDGWRYMLGVSAVPSLILFTGFLFMPESPRWLIAKGRTDEARVILSKLRGQSNVDEEVQHIRKVYAESTKEMDTSIKRILSTSSTRRALILGCGLQAFQQLSGINTVMYYSGTIIQLAGVSDQSKIIWLTAVVATGNFVFTLISMLIIDKVGRRTLTLLSVLGVTLALCLLGGTFIVLKQESPKVSLTVPRNYTAGCRAYDSCYSCVEDKSCGFCFVKNNGVIFNGSCLTVDDQNANHRQSPFCNESTYDIQSSSVLYWSDNVCPTSYAWLAVLAMILYLAMFAPGLGPMAWTVNAEIYPLWARSFGLAASTATNWSFNLIVALTFLDVMNFLTRPGAFFMYASITFVGFLFLYFFQPETKGRRLEDIEELFN